MSTTYIDGTDWIISVSDTAGGTYKAVAALTGNKLTGTLSNINFSSKQGNLYAPGDQFDESFEGEAFCIDESGTPSEDSYKELRTYYAAKTQFYARFGKLHPDGTQYYFYGQVFLDKFDVDAPYNAGAKFTVSFKATVPPFSLYSGY